MSEPRLLLFGALVGLAMALWSALGIPSPQHWTGGGDVAARINGVAITQVDLDRAVEALVADRRNELSDVDIHDILETLIDEELLLQRAQELDMARSSRPVRQQMVSEMIALATANAAPAEPAEPDEQTLRAFYDDNLHLVGTQTFVRVRHAVIAGDMGDMLSPIQEGIHQGQDFETLINAEPLAEWSRVPNALLPEAKLRDYLGPSLAQQTMDGQVDEIIGPIEIGKATHYVQIIERNQTAQKSFEDARDILLAEWVRTQDDKALADYLERLRRQAKIEISGSPNS